MNLLHMKYAVEVAGTRSINKAAEKLFVGQSALSRAIKELEAGLGTTLFERSSKGMTLTPDGEVFVRYAKLVLRQVDDIEDMFSAEQVSKKRFSISVPRASYVADAFARFSLLIDEHSEAEIFYRETNAKMAIKNVLEDDSKLGILRYADHYDKYYKALIEEKGLDYELITEFHYILLMHEDSPLAALQEIRYEDLRQYIEIAHADPYVPSLPLAEVRKEELPDRIERRIFVFERGSQFELLTQNPHTFMWVSPLPQAMLKRFHLIQRDCAEPRRLYKDVLIHKKDYTLSELDHQFIEQLVSVKREVF